MKLEIGNVLQIMSADFEVLDIRVWTNDGCKVIKQCPIFLNDKVKQYQHLIDEDNLQSATDALNGFLRSTESLLRL